MTEKGERQFLKSLLKKEMRYLDVDGTAILVEDMIDAIMEQDKKKRQFSTG